VANLRILYDVDGWAFHKRALALQKYAPADFEVSISPCRTPEGSVNLAHDLGDSSLDVIFLIDQASLDHVKAALQPCKMRPKLVVGWNDGWPARLDRFFQIQRAVDHVIVNNRQVWKLTGGLANTSAIANGVDPDLFQISVSPRERPHKILWVGSTFHRENKGYDSLLMPLQTELRALGIECDFMLMDSLGSKCSSEEMALWYNSGTVILVASRIEGTPNPALEAAACGCTIVSTAVGNMPDLINDGMNGYLVSNDLGSFRRRVLDACENYLALSGQMKRDIRQWFWPVQAGLYYDLFRKLLTA
jgi:glycosyltransferase involved in cell wall biosynthesis